MCFRVMTSSCGGFPLQFRSILHDGIMQWTSIWKWCGNLSVYIYIYHDNDATNLTQIPKMNLKMCCEKYYFVSLNRYYDSQSQTICPAFCKGYFQIDFQVKSLRPSDAIFVIKLTIIVSDNGLSPSRHQAII